MTSAVLLTILLVGVIIDRPQTDTAANDLFWFIVHILLAIGSDVYSWYSYISLKLIISIICLLCSPTTYVFFRSVVHTFYKSLGEKFPDDFSKTEAGLPRFVVKKP